MSDKLEPTVLTTCEQQQAVGAAMAAVVAVCSGLGRKKLMHFITAVVCLTDPRLHAVLWRSCSQYKQVTSNEELPIPMEILKRDLLNGVHYVENV